MYYIIKVRDDSENQDGPNVIVEEKKHLDGVLGRFKSFMSEHWPALEGILDQRGDFPIGDVKVCLPYDFSSYIIDWDDPKQVAIQQYLNQTPDEMIVIDDVPERWDDPLSEEGIDPCKVEMWTDGDWRFCGYIPSGDQVYTGIFSDHAPACKSVKLEDLLRDGKPDSDDDDFYDGPVLKVFGP